MPISTPQSALQSMQAGSQGGPGVDPNNDPYGLADVAQQQGAPYGQQPQQPAPPEPESDDSSNPSNRLRAMIEEVNIAEHLDEDTLQDIADECMQGFLNDKESRTQWEHRLDDWVKLAQQVQEQKAYPWPKASNIKYPLLSTAAMQFAARAYPTLVPSDGNIVIGQVIGKDPDDTKSDQAERIGTYMSFDIMHNMKGWEEDMDKMLLELPLVGVMFKKTFWDSTKKKNCSYVIRPKNLVVNYWAACLDEAERISEIIPMSGRKIKQRQMAGLFLKDVDLGNPPQLEHDTLHPNYADNFQMPANDSTTPFEIVEQHTYYDLDGDDYAEPYIVTFHPASRKILRITARYDETTMQFSDEGDLIGIDPISYYTKFGFIPNPDGGFYDIGFGQLLGPLNESVNTLVNQLVDAGTLNNLQSGFIGKGLRLRMGDDRFQPGEWKAVNATGDDLKKSIFPMPTKEPSAVLFQLLGTLVTSAKELASVADIFTGKMPGQNTPATTTMATVEQGMKVFTAIYKRIYRSLAEEFMKLFKLNATYLNPDTYSSVIGEQIGPDDFDLDAMRVYPAADPNAVSAAEKLQKAQALLEILPLGVLDPIEVIKRVLIAQEQPNYEKLFNQQVQQTGQMPPPQPDPKVQEMQMKSQAEQQKLQLTAQAQQQKAQMDQASQQAQLHMKAAQAQQDMELKAQQATLQSQIDLHTANSKVAAERMQAVQSAQQAHDTHQQALQQQSESHQQALKQQKQISQEKAKSTQKSTTKPSSTGRKTR